MATQRTAPSSSQHLTGTTSNKSPSPTWKTFYLFTVHTVGGIAGPTGIINFPKLSPSPTHAPRTHHLPAIPTGGQQLGRQRPQLPRQPQVVPSNENDEDYIPAPRMEPLSFEQALAMGRGLGRQLPSPMPNGYKPGQAADLQPSLAQTDRRLVNRRQLRPVPASSRTLQQGGDERHTDSDDDDWC